MLKYWLYGSLKYYRTIELRDTDFKVNGVDPGHTVTDVNNYKGEKTVEKGAGVIVNMQRLIKTVRHANFSAKKLKQFGKKGRLIVATAVD